MDELARCNLNFVKRVKSVVIVSLFGASIFWGVLVLRANNHQSNGQAQNRPRAQTKQESPADNDVHWVADPLLGWVRVEGKPCAPRKSFEPRRSLKSISQYRS